MIKLAITAISESEIYVLVITPVKGVYQLQPEESWKARFMFGEAPTPSQSEQIEAAIQEHLEGHQ